MEGKVKSDALQASPEKGGEADLSSEEIEIFRRAVERGLERSELEELGFEGVIQRERSRHD